MIGKANATVTANSKTVTANGQTQTVTGFTATGLVNGETESVLTGVTTSGGSGVNAGTYNHVASGTDVNYNLTFIDGVLTINAAPAPAVQQLVSVPVVPPASIPQPRPGIQTSPNSAAGTSARSGAAPTASGAGAGGTNGGSSGSSVGAGGANGGSSGSGAGTGGTNGGSPGSNAGAGGTNGGSSGSGAGTGGTSGSSSGAPSGTRISLEASGTINAVSSGQSSAVPGFVTVKTFDPIVVSSSGSFQVELPKNTFTHSDSDTPIQISATTENGEPLPEWASFSAADLSLTGTPPQGVTSLSVVVTATDANGNQVSTQLTINFSGSNG